MTYSLIVPVRFLKTYDQIMQAATVLAGDNGRDEDVPPASLNAALLEILLFGQSARDLGVIFLPSDVPKRGSYRFTVPIDLMDTPASIRRRGRLYLPTGWRGTMQNTLMAIMNSGTSPADEGFEVDDAGWYGPHQSAHEQVADYERVKANPYTGPDTPGLDAAILATGALLT